MTAPMNSAEVAAVAKGLTKAQRDWIVRGWRSDGRGFWPVRNSLAAKGLIDSSFGNTLTATGRLLRNHILASENPHAD